MTGKAFIGLTVTLAPYSVMGVLHIKRGKPLISAEHDPHLAALQFHLTARSDAMLACTHRTASSTTMPSRTGTRYETTSPPLESPRHMFRSRFEISISGYSISSGVYRA